MKRITHKTIWKKRLRVLLNESIEDFFYQKLQGKSKTFTYVILLILRLAGFGTQIQGRKRMGNRCTQKVLEFLGRLERDIVLDIFLEEKTIRHTFK